MGLEVGERTVSLREGFGGAEEDAIDAVNVLANSQQCVFRKIVLKCESKARNYRLIVCDRCLEEARVLLETRRR